MGYKIKSILFVLTLLFVLSFLVEAQTIERTVYTVDKCDSLYINVSGTLPINDTEYSFKECIETSSNYWSCDCTDNYNITMNYKINTINNYTLSIKSTFETYKSSGGSGGSGGSHRHYYTDDEPTNTTNNISLNKQNETNNNVSDNIVDSNNTDSENVSEEITTSEDINIVIDSNNTDNKTGIDNNKNSNNISILTIIGIVLLIIGLIILLIFIRTQWRK